MYWGNGASTCPAAADGKNSWRTGGRMKWNHFIWVDDLIKMILIALNSFLSVIKSVFIFMEKQFKHLEEKLSLSFQIQNPPKKKSKHPEKMIHLSNWHYACDTILKFFGSPLPRIRENFRKPIKTQKAYFHNLHNKRNIILYTRSIRS